MLRYDPNNLSRARTLRKDMTPWERKLWHLFLKTYPIRFQRQKPLGEFIVDFYCAQAKLIVELDGNGHYTDEQTRYDRRRTDVLESMGFHVVRYTNADVDKNFHGVCEDIDAYVKRHS